MKNKFMSRAIELSIESVNNGTGPFGAVVVKNEKIIAIMPIRMPVNKGTVEKLVIHLINSAIGPDNKFPENVDLNFVSPAERPSLTYSTKSCLKPTQTVNPRT